MQYMKPGVNIWRVNPILTHIPDQRKIKGFERELKNLEEVGASVPQNKLIAIRIPRWLDLQMRLDAENLGTTYSDFVRQLLWWKYEPAELLASLKSGDFIPDEKDKESLMASIHLALNFNMYAKMVDRTREWVDGVMDQYQTLSDELDKFLSGKNIKFKPKIINGAKAKKKPKK